MMPKPTIKPITATVKQEDKVEAEEQPEVAVDTKIEPRVTRGAQRDQKQVNNSVTEEFYDDFPIEIIKKYNLKISNKRKEEIALGRRRKTNLKNQSQKPVEEQKMEESPKNSQ